uniref:Uncharacterized protein n=1 Tax=Sphaerodactylus townsendi TaxID=933632 RepID=A0ACB8EK84_9SAUR
MKQHRSTAAPSGFLQDEKEEEALSREPRALHFCSQGNLLHLQQQPLLLLMLWYAVRMRSTLELLHWLE